MPIQRMIIQARCETCDLYHDIADVKLIENTEYRLELVDAVILENPVYQLPTPQCRVSGPPFITLIDQDEYDYHFNLEKEYEWLNRRARKNDKDGE